MKGRIKKYQTIKTNKTKENKQKEETFFKMFFLKDSKVKLSQLLLFTFQLVSESLWGFLITPGHIVLLLENRKASCLS